MLQLFLFLGLSLGIFSALYPIYPVPAKLTESEQKRLNEALGDAVALGYTLEKIEKWLNQGANPNYIYKGPSFNRNPYEQTSLMNLIRDRYNKKLNISDDADEKALLLLQYGANPNIFDTTSFTWVDILVDTFPQLEEAYSQKRYQKKMAELLNTFMIAVLFGGRAYMLKNSATLKKILILAFPQALIRAIAIQDVALVKALLAVADSEPVRDSEGVSALVYAAGQGNPEIVALLLAHPAYGKDTSAIEEALEIIAARLRGMAPRSKLSAPAEQYLHNFMTWLLPASYQKHFESTGLLGWKTDFPTYEQYQEVIKLLESHLEQTVRNQLKVFIDQAIKEKSVQAQLGMPEEIQQEIFDKLLGNKDIFKRLFRQTS